MYLLITHIFHATITRSVDERKEESGRQVGKSIRSSKISQVNKVETTMFFSQLSRAPPSAPTEKGGFGLWFDSFLDMRGITSIIGKPM